MPDCDQTHISVSMSSRRSSAVDRRRRFTHHLNLRRLFSKVRSTKPFSPEHLLRRTTSPLKHQTTPPPLQPGPSVLLTHPEHHRDQQSLAATTQPLQHQRQARPDQPRSSIHNHNACLPTTQDGWAPIGGTGDTRRPRRDRLRSLRVRPIFQAQDPGDHFSPHGTSS